MTTTHQKRTLVERGWRYTLIGAICALSNYAIMLSVDFLGGHYLLGTVIAFIIVTPMAYVLHSLFTFAEPFRLKAFMRFVGGVASAYPVATALMIILCSGLRLSVAIATPIATVAMFAWNFGAAHWSILPGFGLSGSTQKKIER
jgi:putative flippase GtrA